MMSRSGKKHARMVQLNDAASNYERVVHDRESRGIPVPKVTKNKLRQARDEINVGLTQSEMCSSQIDNAEQLLDDVRSAL